MEHGEGVQFIFLSIQDQEASSGAAWQVWDHMAVGVRTLNSEFLLKYLRGGLRCHFLCLGMEIRMGGNEQ